MGSFERFKTKTHFNSLKRLVGVTALAALAVIGAATANFLPSFSLPSFSLPSVSLPSLSLPNLDRFSLPKFDQVSLPNFDQFSLPNFKRIAAPKSDRVAAQAPPKPAPVPMPDPITRAILRDIQSSQQQSADVLASLTQSSETQQADIKRISRQLNALSAQVNALHGSVGPLTTGSIPHPNARARILRTAKKLPPSPPALPKPVGPVSVGGAPLNPVPAAPGPANDSPRPPQVSEHQSKKTG